MGLTCLGTEPESDRVAAGSWGGEHVLMIVTPDSARLEFDCAAGGIAGPLLLDGNRRFEAEGWFASGGGPVRIDDPQRRETARYAGRVDGDRLSLTVRLDSRSTTIGPYELILGRDARVYRCL